MTAALNYVDSCNAAANDTLDNTEAPEVSGMESSEFSKDDENRSHALKKKTNANETFDKGLKLLKEANQSGLCLKIDGRFDNLSCYPQSATPGSQKRFSLADYSPSRTLAMSRPAKNAGSKIGSNGSKIRERRRLEIQAELIDQKSQMEIEKKRELELKKTRWQMEVDLEELKKKGYGKKMSKCRRGSNS